MTGLPLNWSSPAVSRYRLQPPRDPTQDRPGGWMVKTWRQMVPWMALLYHAVVAIQKLWNLCSFISADNGRCKWWRVLDWRNLDSSGLSWCEYINGPPHPPPTHFQSVVFLITILPFSDNNLHINVFLQRGITNRNWTCYRFDRKKRSTNDSWRNVFSPSLTWTLMRRWHCSVQR